MVKKIFLIIGVFTITFLKCHSQNVAISRLIVKYVNARITTPIEIRCEDFEKSFGKNQMYEKTIEVSATLHSFEKILEKVKYLKDTPSIDVRTKLYVYFLKESKPKIICMSKFKDISIDGVIVANNKHLIKLIQGCLE